MHHQKTMLEQSDAFRGLGGLAKQSLSRLLASAEPGQGRDF